MSFATYVNTELRVAWVEQMKIVISQCQRNNPGGNGRGKSHSRIR